MSKLVAIGEFNTRLEAEITVNLLGSFDVESWISTDDLGGLGPAQALQHGVRVLVEEKDFERARSILDREPRR